MRRFSSLASSGSAAVASGAPLRLAILGGGLSGLALAHALQRRLREAGRSGDRIDVLERQERAGGWLRSDNLRGSSTPSSSAGFLVERGPRSFLYRSGEASCLSTLELLRQLDLGSQVITADRAAAKRFVWHSNGQGGSEGRTVLLPGGLGSFWRFPHRSAILAGLRRDFATPRLEPWEDESVHSWVTRRFNATVADQLVDPLIAGIYAGDPKQLSMSSCLARLPAMEARSGGVLRDVFFAPAAVKAARKVERAAAFDAAQLRVPDAPWMVEAKRTGIYTLRGGVSSLTHALLARLADDSNDAYSRTLPGADAVVALQRGAQITGLRVDEAHRPVLQLASPSEGKTERTYDHVFSTLPSHALHSLLASPTSSLPLSVTHQSQLTSLLSPDSMPSASLWVVHLVYSGAVLPADQRGFGLLVPSVHAIPGLEVLGVTFDSCVFPGQNTTPTKEDGQPAETRLTVMLGGARHPHLAALSEDDAKLHALRAVHAMLGLDPREHRPLVVDAHLNERCIPQYLVGHAKRVHDVRQLLQHVAYTPSSLPAHPTGAVFPSISVPASAPTAAAPRLPLTILGTTMGGVSLNDCIHHAMHAANDFVDRETRD